MKKIIIDERDFGIKRGQAINLLIETFPERYLAKTNNDGKESIELDEKKLLIDALKLAKQLIISETKSLALARKYWADEEKQKDVLIYIR